MVLTATLLIFLLGLEVVVPVLLALLVPVLGGVTWYSGSSAGSSSQLSISRSTEGLFLGTKADDPSTVFPVNIVSISSKYSGKPALNFLKSEWPCNIKTMVMQCCTKLMFKQTMHGCSNGPLTTNFYYKVYKTHA